MASLLARARPGLTSSSFSAPRRLASSKAGQAKPSRAIKFARRTAYVAAGVGAGLGADQLFNEQAVTRNLRTLWMCAVIAVDYKLNFTPDTSEAIPALHERVAERMYNLLVSNGGLYIKMGQAIGANAALLPKAFQARFARLFDDAPQVPYETVIRVFEKEFGRPPDGPNGMFAYFEKAAAASASIAQVHRAKTHDGEWVAVKIQKPAVGKQVEWDLAAFKAVMWMYEHWIFQLPCYFVADFITTHLRRELDFVLEAQNAEETARYIAKEPRLRDRVHVPRVYKEYSSTRVMTAEWIDGVRMSDKPGVQKLMGEGQDGSQPTELKTPEGPKLVHPLNGGRKWVGTTMVDLFCAQIFDWGWLHCDPHPGNIIIRPHPSRPSTAQLVLLDHGLYVRLTEEFRTQYAVLWKALLTVDQDTIVSVTSSWGFGAPDLFASATLLRPIRFGKNKAKTDQEVVKPPEQLSNYELGVRMKAQLKSFLTDTDKMPKELVFIARNMRIVQGNNAALGSPVNRVKVMGTWASGALVSKPGLSATQRISEYFMYLRFRTAIFALDTAFWANQLRGWLRERFGFERVGFEDELEKRMRGIAKTNFGMDIAPDAFNG